MNGEGEITQTSVEELLRLLSEKDALIQNLQQKVTNLSFENQKLKATLFGKRSEKLSRKEETYLLGFNEAEASAPPEEIPTGNAGKTTVRSHSRGKGGRKPLPADLPRREIVHDLPDSEKICGKGHELKYLGSDISERLHIVPMMIEVERHIRKKYICPICSKKSKDPVDELQDGPEVIMAPQAPSLIPGSIITVALFVFIIIGKFCDALPFYRLGVIFKRFGIDLTRQTMAAWSIRVAKDHRRLRKILYDELRSSYLIHLDETTTQVLKEANRPPTTKSRMWVYRGVSGKGTVVLYEYRPTREGRFLLKRLRGFRGTFVSDAYDGYNHLEKVAGLIRAGCWAHVRRKFYEVHTYGKPTNTSRCFLDQIGELYRLEEECRNMDPDERKMFRQKYSKDIVDEIFTLLKIHEVTVLPGSDLGKAIRYTLDEWSRLTVFIEDGRVPIDNNPVENDIRPFTIGRKNWMFFDTTRGASASAFFYSLIQTAKANGHDPHHYLYYLLDHLLVAGKDKESLRRLLPMYLEPEQVSGYFNAARNN